MNAIQNIFNLYAPEYLKLYGNNMPENHRRTISAIQQCRHGSFGANVFRCASCGNIHITQCSCGNHHCPTCQNDKAEQWLINQSQNLLPCSYFLLTFTVPDELRPFFRSNQQAAYSAMFSASSDALKTLAKDKRFIGAEKTDLPVYFVPGEDSFSTIHIFTSLFREEGFLKMGRSGSLPARTSLYTLSLFPLYIELNSVTP